MIKITNAKNGQLFRRISKLAKVQRLRAKLIDMYEYVKMCSQASKNRFVQNLMLFGDQNLKNNKSRMYLIQERDNLLFYSLNDLIDIATGKMYRNLKTVEHELCLHIRFNCLTCKGRGHYCKLCGKGSTNLKTLNQPLFPFDMNDTVEKVNEENIENFHNDQSIYVCHVCGTVYHNSCVLRASREDKINGFVCKTCEFIESKKRAREADLAPEPVVQNRYSPLSNLLKSQRINQKRLNTSRSLNLNAISPFGDCNSSINSTNNFDFNNNFVKKNSNTNNSKRSNPPTLSSLSSDFSSTSLLKSRISAISEQVKTVMNLNSKDDNNSEDALNSSFSSETRKNEDSGAEEDEDGELSSTIELSTTREQRRREGFVNLLVREELDLVLDTL